MKISSHLYGLIKHIDAIMDYAEYRILIPLTMILLLIWLIRQLKKRDK